ncbi:MAG: Rieske (2Fe-2S) protein, partial [Actinomycetota bacterium]|nr:Rieske (2Fe-2S) protein [Actinomycetota bacterium]
AGAAAAAAAGVVGAVAESQLRPGPPTRPVATGEIVPHDGQWVAVASAEDLARGNVARFATATTVGFVTGRGEAVSAVSGSCTHQGCLLRLNEAAGRLDCPCHRTAFAFDGQVLFNQLETPPAPLPEIRVRNRDGQIEAFLPREV